MSGHAQQHDYHLVDPSYLPLVGSVGAFTMALGGLIWIRDDLFSNTPLVFVAGLLIVLYTMFDWWTTVVREAGQGHHTPVVQLHMRYGMMMFIASEVMFFVAWFWAYFGAALYPEAGGAAIILADGSQMVGEVTNYVSGTIPGIVDAGLEHGQIARAVFGDSTWPPAGIEVLAPWHYPLYNTVILLASGTTVTWAHHALIEGDRKGLIAGLWLTVMLGLIFTGVQAYEYATAPFAFAGSIYGSTFFMATGFHGFHVIIGTIFLIVCLFRSYAGHFKPEQHFGFEAAAWYWHFVDVVWLFLFASIYVWGSMNAVIAH